MTKQELIAERETKYGEEQRRKQMEKRVGRRLGTYYLYASKGYVRVHVLVELTLSPRICIFWTKIAPIECGTARRYGRHSRPLTERYIQDQ
jgi:hypothetical protein